MFEILKIHSVRNLLILAILIRLLIMPFYFHPDIKTYHFQASFLKLGVWDIYSYLANEKDRLPLKEEFVYFPLTYFFLGGYQIIISPLLGSEFTSWLFDASQQASERIGVFRYLFLLKLPYLFLDVFIALILVRFFTNVREKKKIFTIWLFNPITIILIYAFSNIDIIPASLTLLSLYIAQRKKRIVLSALILGIAAGFKAYPLLFLPVLFLLGENIKQRMLILSICLGVFLLTIFPFIKSLNFQQAVLTSGLMTRIFLPGVSLGFGETIMVSVVALFVLFFFLLIDKIQIEHLWRYFLSLLLLLFSFIHFHIQWALWIIPLLLLLILIQKKFTSISLIIMTIIFLIPLLYEDRSMTIQLLQLYSHLYNLLPIPFGMLQKVYNPYTIQSVLHSILAAASLVLIWNLFNNSKNYSLSKKVYKKKA